MMTQKNDHKGQQQGGVKAYSFSFRAKIETLRYTFECKFNFSSEFAKTLKENSVYHKEHSCLPNSCSSF